MLGSFVFAHNTQGSADIIDMSQRQVDCCQDEFIAEKHHINFGVAPKFPHPHYSSGWQLPVPRAYILLVLITGWVPGLAVASC